MAFIWNTSRKNASFEPGTLNQCCYFFNCHYISFQDMQSFFEFLVSVINHYHINCINFVTILKDFVVQIFPLISKALWSKINNCYSILLSNLTQKKHIIISRFISNHMDPMYIETPRLSLRVSKKKPHYQMQFIIVPKIPVFKSTTNWLIGYLDFFRLITMFFTQLF